MNKDIQELLVKEYGFNDGMRIAMVVLPNIFADFEKTLAKSVPGVEVSEEYRFDDREGVITVHGLRQNGETTRITGVEINGKVVEL